jgi:outer membrane protein OmpA-like peptidoglycan-associated protein
VPNCCPQFETGEGSGYSFGLNYQFPLPFRLSAGLGLGYYVWNADLIAYETKPVRIDNRIEQASIKHTLESELSDIGFTPYLSYNITGGLNIFAGGHIGYIVLSQFRQYETLVEPEQGFFHDTGTRIRNDTSGNIPEIETVYSSLFFGVQYDIRLGAKSHWLISPTLTYNWGRSNIIKNYDWRANALMFGLQLKYSPPVIKQTEEIYKEAHKIDTLTFLSEDYLRDTVITGRESIKEISEKNNNQIIHKKLIFRTDTLFKRPKPRLAININVPVIKLEGQFVTQAFPLIPVVFFNKNEADLSAYYHLLRETDAFSIDKLHINPVEYQKNLLNIVGYRMQKYADAKLYITGYCDSISEGMNYPLAEKRSKAIFDYLKKTWKIKPSRLIIRMPSQCSPPDPTETRNDSGYADNRRAELSSDNDELLAPIKNKKYIEPRTINPPVMIFDPAGSTEKGIARWALIVRKGDDTLSQRSGDGYPGLLRDTLKTKDFAKLFSNEPLTIEFSMVDYEGQIGTLRKEIPVIADTAEYELQRLSLILFKVGDEKLTEKAKKDIREFLKEINSKSIIRIHGYTDPLGTERLNKELSKKRAETTAKFIKRLLPKADIEQVKGLASEKFPPGIDSYGTPMHRFLSRTVFIEILKKIK